MDLPSWIQFALTLAGGFVMGLATAWIAAFRRLNRQEGQLAAIETTLKIADLPRLENRMQGTEQSLYGRRGEIGIVQRMDHVDNGIEKINLLLREIATKLGIEDDR